ncbi:DUF4192 domain-containing protein [Nonomuraea sp. NPDC046802]|uniref:DUF4192 domain-containing protein n=1 Tax=Nonomuraea sp. NPDC046802 TaxID=3154919 RepID=UPI0033EC75FC
MFPDVPPDRHLRLAHASALLGVTPYLLEYHPADAIIAIAFTSTGALAGIASVDLPGPDADLVAMATRAKQSLENEPSADHVALIGYGTKAHVKPLMDVMRFLLDHSSRLHLVEALRFHDNTYWSYLCSDACCPPDGISFDPTCSPVAAQATILGMTTLPDAAAHVAQFAPVTGTPREQMREATRRVRDQARHMMTRGHDWRAELLDRVASCSQAVDLGQKLDDEQVAWLEMLTSSTLLRDLAATLAEPGEDDRVHLRMWSEVLRRVDPADAVAPALLTAIYALRSGNGPVAQIALNRALDTDPGNRTALQMRQVAKTGVTPAQIRSSQITPTALTEQAKRCPEDTWPVLPQESR